MTKYNKIFIFISITFFFIYIFIIFSTYFENKNYLLENTKNNQLKLVHAYKEKFDERLLALKRIVKSIGDNIITKDRDDDFDLIKETLTTAISSGSGLTSVYISYPDNFTISGLKWWSHSDDYIATERPWYKEAIENKKLSITKPYVGSAGFNGIVYFSVVYPMYKSGKLLAVISGDLELKSIQNDLASLFPLKDGFAFLMTNTGYVIQQPNKLKIDLNSNKIKNILRKIGKKGNGEKELLINNKNYIITYKTLQNSDWVFVSVLNEKAIYSKLNHQLFMNLFATFILVFLGFGSMIFISLTQKKLHEQHILFGLFSKSPTWAVLLTDKYGKILFVNKSFENIFELQSKSIYGKPLDNILPHLIIKNASCKEKSCLKTIIENPTKIISYTFKKNKEHYRVQITPLMKKYKKEFEGAMITTNNITNEKNLEKKDQEHEQILIQNSKMAALGEMVSAISHQWRQPLSTLLMLVSNTEDMIEEKKLPKALDYLGRSRNNINLMNETIMAFRNFYKEDFGKATFNLTDIINEVMLISTPQMNMNGIEFQLKCEDSENYTCIGYPSYIKQVLINLIGNAKDELAVIIKENPLYEAKVMLNLYRDDNGYYISIEDNGKGITKENSEKIFEPFFTTKGEQGTGTGLHLCKLLTETKMNGKITIESLSNPTKFLIYIGKEDV